MKASEFLRETAKHINKVGLNQNGGYYNRYTSFQTDECPACVVGAMMVVRAASEIDIPNYFKAHEALAFSLGASVGASEYQITRFSDGAPSQEVVIAKLLSVAEDLDTKGD